MPRMSGLASGLRARVWVSAPARPRAAPTATATTVCGSRSSMTMNRWPASPPPEQGADHVADRDREVADRQVDRDQQEEHAGADERDERRRGPAPATTRRRARNGGLDVARTAIRAAPSGVRRTRNTNAGPPTSAITMPTWSSAGRTTSRPIDVGEGDEQRRRAARSRAPPSGSRRRRAGGRGGGRRGRRSRSVRRRRSRRRSSSMTAAMPRAFCRHGLRPSEAATSSPSWSRLRPGVLIGGEQQPEREERQHLPEDRRSSRPDAEPTTQNR